MESYLDYFKNLSPGIFELMESGCISGATITFPVNEPRAQDVSLHYTGHGILASMGDKFSSKLITTWTEPPVLYDIMTNDVIGPIEFVDTTSYGHGVDAFMRKCATLDIEVTAQNFSEVIENKYSNEFAAVNVSLLRLEESVCQGKKYEGMN